MKMFAPALIVSMILIMGACQIQVLIFDGKSENWSAELTVIQTDGDERYEIQITYMGNELDQVETFDFFVQAELVSFSGSNVFLNKTGEFQKKMLGSNSPSTKPKDELNLRIEWDGKSESIILKRK